MAQVSPQRGAALGQIPTNAPWRSRTALACAVLAVMVLGGVASTLDWSEGLALTLGQLAGMVAPPIALSLIAWAIVAMAGRSR
ncbi:MAG: hypothetical protein JWO72_679 [Caulobacteraceae bacterium]|nr:hypothetical protein [Caulobacteraceae bacterium]